MSATNSEVCKKDAKMLEGVQGYKYLGITEDSNSVVMRESFDKIKADILVRIERLCQSKLNGKNLIKAINEHALSVINYHIGLQRLDPKDFQEIDHEVRQTLTKYRIHL